ncbi:MAG: NAD(+) synthase [Tissierellia bacterium]|nr:NAD(+) synthase [Tissierellia bacterium]
MNYQTLVKDIVSWMRDYAKNAGTEGFVFGLSGGIDSAVIAALSKKAFPDHSLGLIMPCESMDKDREDALKIAQAIDLKVEEVDLTDTFHELIKVTFEGKSQLAKSNIKPRLRMTTLYYYGQELNYLIVGPSNASEWYVGYSTKYGDSGADLFPILQLVKSEVVELAQALGLPQFVLDKKPSAGLWVGQTDEEEMGFSYDVLDQYILGIQEPDPAVKARIDHMHKASAHKRKMAPQFKVDRKK